MLLYFSIFYCPEAISKGGISAKTKTALPPSLKICYNMLGLGNFRFFDSLSCNRILTQSRRGAEIIDFVGVISYV